MVQNANTKGIHPEKKILETKARQATETMGLGALEQREQLNSDSGDEIMAEAGTLCINADVEKFSGANGSATADVEAYTNVYILEAEGIICIASRYDFVTNYASLTAIAKEFLRDATASLAAISVIAYDMSGYTSRIEAENMINILWAKWNQARKHFEDQKFVTWSKI